MLHSRLKSGFSTKPDCKHSVWPTNTFGNVHHLLVHFDFRLNPFGRLVFQNSSNHELAAMWKSGQNIQIFFLLLLFSFSIVMSCTTEESDKARYDNYRLIRVHLETEDHVKLFQELEEQSDSYTFYGHALSAPQDVTILVAAHK